MTRNQSCLTPTLCNIKAGDRPESSAHDIAGRCRQLLEYTLGAVTRNKSEKKINSLLDYVAGSTNSQLLQQFYATTLGALQVFPLPKDPGGNPHPRALTVF